LPTKEGVSARATALAPYAGMGAGKASPNFDLGPIGNVVFGLVGGGVLGQIVTRPCAFSLSITAQVLKFRAKAQMRVTPPKHRTSHGQ